MRISEIKVHNLTRVRARLVRIPATAAVVLIAGPNGSGKSTLLEAIRFALTGTELPRGLAYKKDLARAITRGETKGSVSVSVVNGDHTSEYKISLTTGNYAGSSAPPMGAAALTLMPQNFMRLTPSERRKALFQRAGIDVSTKGAVGDLLSAGFEEKDIEGVRRFLGAGFEKAASVALDLVSEARGAWQAITGETFGTIKAQDWRADAPTVETPPAVLEAELNDLLKQQQIAADAMRSLDSTVALSRDRPRHEEIAGKHDALTAELDGIDTRIAEKQIALGAVTGSDDAPPAGWTCECPACGELLRSPQAGKLALAGAESPPPSGPTAAQLRKELATLQADRKRVANALEHAVGSKHMLLQMPAAPTDTELAEARSELQQVNADVSLVRSKLQQAHRDTELAATAEDRTQRAQAEFTKWNTYTAMAKAIEKLPANYLSKAIAQVNEAMAVVASAFAESVSISEDMDLYYGQTPYDMASESEQWRMDLALGIALAHIDSGVVLMDRFDVLEPAARGPVLQMLAEVGVQVVIAATLKAKPTMPTGYHVEWLGREPE
jgi:AAA domain